MVFSGPARLRMLAPWLVVLLAVPSLAVTAPHLLSEAPIAQGPPIPPPEGYGPVTGGYLYIVLDGVREDVISSPEWMPKLNARLERGALLQVLTGPLTMTGATVREMATGVPATPAAGLENFRPKHPGSVDGYISAARYDRDGDGKPELRVGTMGDFSWDALYKDVPEIVHEKYYYGHSDLYRGDIETFEALHKWLDVIEEPGAHDVIVAHFGGPDHVGHHSDAIGREYRKKMRWTDDHLEGVFQKVPSDWTVVVTADHGMTHAGRHGGQEPLERKVGAVLFGAAVRPGTSAHVRQRDLASLPLALFALPFPIAMDSRIPVDVLDVDDGTKDALVLWNWQAAVARQDWLVAQGVGGVAGLDPQVVQWDRLPDQPFGVRTIDVVLTLGVFLALGLLGWIALGQSWPGTARAWTGAAVATLLTVVLAWAALGNGTLATLSQFLGIGLMAAFLLYAWWRVMVRGTAVTDDVLPYWMPLAFLAVLVVFSQTRLSAIVYTLPFLFALTVRRGRERIGSRPAAAMIVLGGLSVLLALLMHHRVLGYNVAVELTIWFHNLGPVRTLGSLALLAAAWLFAAWTMARSSRIMRGLSALGLLAAYLVGSAQQVPYEIALEWIALTAMLGAFALAAFGASGRGPARASPRLALLWGSALWVSITWGAWPAAVGMAVVAGTEALLAGPLHRLAVRRARPRDEAWRLALTAVLPWAMWFLLWAGWGQVYGLHPRELNPGSLVLDGGYVGLGGDPPIVWFGLMIMGPPAAVSALLFAGFSRHGVSLRPMLAAVALRLTASAAMLAFAPQLLRLIFRLAWDAAFASFLFLVVAIAIGVELWARKQARALPVPRSGEGPGE